MYPSLELYLIDTWAAVECLNVIALNQTEINLKAGTLSIAWDLDDVPPDLGKDDAVALRVKQDAADAGTVIFSGTISGRTSNGTTITYTAGNVLDDLKHLIYVVGGETNFNLFRDADDAVLNIGEQIAAALDYAAAQGIDVTYTQAELDALDLNMPATEVTDITVYEVVKKALVYRSDIMVAVQYAAPGSADTIRLVDQNDLAAVTYSAITDIETLTATARYDRQVEGVVLVFKWQDADEDGVLEDLEETHSYGITTGTNVMRQQLDIAGAELLLSQDIPTHPYALYTSQTAYNWDDDGGAITENVWEFWAGMARNKSGDKYQIPVYPERGYYDGLVPFEDEIKNIIWPYEASGTKSVIYGTDMPTDPAAIQWLVDNYNARLLEGQCQFMLDEQANTYWPIIEFDEAANTYIIDGFGTLEVRVFSTPDPVPTDLAEQLYNILNPLQYDGQIVRYLDLATPNSICSILRRLNISGTENDLETMAAIIQQCQTNHLAGKQTIKFGAADHLEPKDFIALCRSNRTIGNLRLS